LRKIKSAGGGGDIIATRRFMTMYQHILLPTDGSKLSDRALKAAVGLAKRLGAKITALHVMPTQQMFLGEGFVAPMTISQSLRNQFKKQAALRSKEILENACAQAAAAGVGCETVSVASDTPYRAIIKQAARSGCDLIMMASHGRRGISGVLLGSETAKVLVHSEIPVLVVR
jgi:nucleotide-binding universal stress UspA family protein